jgi:hypothetical protein
LLAREASPQLVNGGAPAASPESAASVTSHHPSHTVTPFTSTNGLQLLQNYSETPAVHTQPRLEGTPPRQVQHLPLTLTHATDGVEATDGGNTPHGAFLPGMHAQEGFGETPVRQLWTLHLTPPDPPVPELPTQAEAGATPGEKEDVTGPGLGEDELEADPVSGTLEGFSFPAVVAPGLEGAESGNLLATADVVSGGDHLALAQSSPRQGPGQGVVSEITAGMDECHAETSIAFNADEGSPVPTLASSPSAGDVPVLSAAPGPAVGMMDPQAPAAIAAGLGAPIDTRHGEETEWPARYAVPLCVPVLLDNGIPAPVDTQEAAGPRFNPAGATNGRAVVHESTLAVVDDSTFALVLNTSESCESASLLLAAHPRCDAAIGAAVVNSTSCHPLEAASGADEDPLLSDGVAHSVLMEILEGVVNSGDDFFPEAATDPEVDGFNPQPLAAFAFEESADSGGDPIHDVSNAQSAIAGGVEDTLDALSPSAGAPAMSVPVPENGSPKSAAAGQEGELVDLMDAVSEFAGSDFGSSEVGGLAAALGASYPTTPLPALKTGGDSPKREQCSPPCTLSPIRLELSLDNLAGDGMAGSPRPSPAGSPAGAAELGVPCVGLLEFPTLVSPLYPSGEPAQSSAPSTSEACSVPDAGRPAPLRFVNFRASIDTRTSPEMGSPAPVVFPSGPNFTAGVTPEMSAGATPWRKYRTPGAVPEAADGPSPGQTAYASAASLSFMGSGGPTPLTNGPPSVTGPYLPHHGSMSVPWSALGSAVPKYYTEPAPAGSPAATEASLQGATLTGGGVETLERSRPPNVRVLVGSPAKEEWEEDVTPDAAGVHGQHPVFAGMMSGGSGHLPSSAIEGDLDSGGCYYTQPPPLDCPSTGSAPVMPKPFSSWHGPLAGRTEPVMVDNPLRQSPAAFPPMPFPLSADGGGTEGDVCTPKGEPESFEVSLDLFMPRRTMRR